MKKVFIYVEGSTEEKFSKEFLSPYLVQHGIFAKPIIANTKVVKAGQNFKGGLGAYPKIRKELCILLRDTSVKAVSTMLAITACQKVSREETIQKATLA